MMCMLQTIAKARFGHDPDGLRRFEARLEEAKEHVRFCCRIYRLQMEAGRYYLHEHPWSARSWQIKEVVDLCEDPRTMIVQAHQCQFGLTAPLGRPGGKSAPVKKPIGFMTNSWAIAQALNKTCPGGHTHAWLDQGRAKKAAIYPKQLCEAICRGLDKQKNHDLLHRTTCFSTMTTDQIHAIQAHYDGDKVDFLHSLVERHANETDGRHTSLGPLGSVESLPSHADEAGNHYYISDVNPRTVVKPNPLIAKDNVHDEDGGHDMFGLRQQDGIQILRDEIYCVMQRDGLVEAWDDVTNKHLDYELVAKARQAEMDYVQKMQVHVQVPRSDIKRTGGKLIGTRWIDVNKNDEKRPDYRSRLVGKEFRRGTDDSLYAATPPRSSTYHNQHCSYLRQRQRRPQPQPTTTTTTHYGERREACVFLRGCKTTQLH